MRDGLGGHTAHGKQAGQHEHETGGLGPEQQGAAAGRQLEGQQDQAQVHRHSQQGAPHNSQGRLHRRARGLQVGQCMGQHTPEAVRGELPDAVQGRGPGEANPRDAAMDPVGLCGAHGRAILSNLRGHERSESVLYWWLSERCDDHSFFVVVFTDDQR